MLLTLELLLPLLKAMWVWAKAPRGRAVCLPTLCTHSEPHEENYKPQKCCGHGVEILGEPSPFIWSLCPLHHANLFHLLQF